MKIAICLSLLILILATPSSALWGRRRRSSSSGSTGSSDSTRGWTVDARASANPQGGTLSGSATYRGNNWNAGVHGSIDNRGNYNVGVGASWQFRKRSIEWNGKHYTVKLDQCYFQFYDLNNDGLLVKEEMYTIFGENSSSDELYESLDITTGDGQIDEDEFNSMAQVTIDGCQPPVEE